MDSATMEIAVNKIQESRVSELPEGLKKFGRIFSDHMFVVDYKDGAWQEARIEPYANLSLSPATSVLHYGQSVFEGMKAYKNDEGKVLAFRPLENIKRLNLSADRMCMPAIPEELFHEGLMQLLDIDKDWVPTEAGSALYIRPFMFATDAYIGVKPSDTYRFVIFTTPVGSYYNEPVRVKVETEYTRAAAGGVGFAKAAGNYAASLYPAKVAQKDGYHQLVWTDYKEHKYIEESGTMNIMFVTGNKIITPATSDTILKGITRDSVLTIARDWGYEVEERKVSVLEVCELFKSGKLSEAFGVGTAATIAHIASITFEENEMILPEVPNRVFSNKVSTYLNELKRGREEDTHGWIKTI